MFLKVIFSCPVLCGCSVYYFLLQNAPFISNFFVPAAFFFCWLSVNGIKGAFEEVNHDGVLGANNNQVYHVKIFRRIKECNIKFSCISGVYLVGKVGKLTCLTSQVSEIILVWSSICIRKTTLHCLH